MENEPNRPSRARENLLAVALTISAGGAIWFFLDLVTMGLMSALLASVIAFTVLIAVHYLVWGRAMVDEVAAEREALRRQDEQAVLPPSDAIQDISRTQGIKKK
jgi:hypothetical protein